MICNLGIVKKSQVNIFERFQVSASQRVFHDAIHNHGIITHTRYIRRNGKPFPGLFHKIDGF